MVIFTSSFLRTDDDGVQHGGDKHVEHSHQFLSKGEGLRLEEAGRCKNQETSGT